MTCRAALLVNGRVVTGINHGDAYSKLTFEEKNGNIESGFFDQQHGEFICEDERVYYMKTILMIRHADAHKNQKDPGITNLGRSQSQRAVSFLNHLNIKSFVAFSSPARRCLETAEEFCNELNIHFETNDAFKEDGEPHSLVKNKLKQAFDDLPPKSLIITHNTIIGLATEIILNRFVSEISIPNCSITLFENSCLVHLGLIVD